MHIMDRIMLVNHLGKHNCAVNRIRQGTVSSTKHDGNNDKL